MWGVYPHAEWNYAKSCVVETGRGFVVREISPAVPYGRMTPVRTFKRKHAADKLADYLTFG